MKKPKVHLRSLRHYVNAGMSFPHCYANAELLDLDKSRLPVSGMAAVITCKRCQAYIRKKKGGHK